ncbi:MAG: ATP-binding domain-containing protein, partial [Hyphomonadaceae bacterium]|nr:ATP-binding domain-containing protein [Clostridia bacterium]
KQEITVGTLIFRDGDKDMQIKNNYDLTWHNHHTPSITGTGVYNGDVGRITKIDLGRKWMEVLYDEEKIVYYPLDELEELELAYAMTVHKSQGSEFAAVVMPVFPGGASMLLNRNLFYTAVTRAKQLVVLVGREQTIRTMVGNAHEGKRYSALDEKLLALVAQA